VEQEDTVEAVEVDTVEVVEADGMLAVQVVEVDGMLEALEVVVEADGMLEALEVVAEVVGTQAAVAADITTNFVIRKMFSLDHRDDSIQPISHLMYLLYIFIFHCYC